jgi:ABC-type lipoprotein export system ATPase subunit
MTESSPSIAIHGLRFSYAESGASADRASAFSLHLDEWKVEKGRRVALHGPSGCGKSTLLDLIAGSLAPHSGQLEVEGSDLAKLSESQRRAHRIRQIGFVFQDFPLVDYLDAEENVQLPYRLDPDLRLDAETRDRAAGLLDDLGLADKRHRRPDELSQGERQRVAIARALVTEPRLLLADEPTAGLDPQNSSRVLDTLESLCEKRNLTLLMVTHDPSLLDRFDDTLAVADHSTTRTRRTSSP